MGLSKELLDIMACSLCKSELKYEGEKLHCRNPECGLIYPVRDEIPIMLIDEAERPCPKCKTTRDWDDDLLKCAKCGAIFRYQRS